MPARTGSQMTDVERIGHEKLPSEALSMLPAPTKLLGIDPETARVAHALASLCER